MADGGGGKSPKAEYVGNPDGVIGGPIKYVTGQSVDVAWVRQLAARLDAATRAGPAITSQTLPTDSLTALLKDACVALKSTPTLLEISPAEDATITVVGDTHGQFHDVLHMMEVAGRPSDTSMYLFNGDYVDRGAWGVELLATLAAYSLALPGRFFMLRGNHESSTCSRAYGFHGELKGKYGRDSKAVFKACVNLFAALPLAALVAGKTLVMHGGLFRKPFQPAKSAKFRGKKRRRLTKEAPMEIGSLDDLRTAFKGGQDPSGLGQTQVAADILWSDPVPAEGLSINYERGIGLVFGPDQTQAFMAGNGLALVLRSHEGPDARCRPECDMPSMADGYSVDHNVPAGRLMTVFSAPDYPQFQPVDDPSERFNNLGAVAVLQAPDWATPVMKQYNAVQPRPEAAPFYDMYLPDSDEEGPEGLQAAGFEPSEASGLSGDGSVVGCDESEDTATCAEAGSPGSKVPRVGFLAEDAKSTVKWHEAAQEKKQDNKEEEERERNMKDDIEMEKEDEKQIDEEKKEEDEREMAQEDKEMEGKNMDEEDKEKKKGEEKEKNMEEVMEKTLIKEDGSMGRYEGARGTVDCGEDLRAGMDASIAASG